MPRAWRWLAASLLLAAAPAPAGAATIVSKSVAIDLAGPAVRERVRLTVRIDDRGDLEEWSHYSVVLDENRKLVRLAASSLEPGGRARSIPEKEMDWVDWAGDGILHGSQRLRVVRFPAVPPGSLLTVEHEVESRPYFPAGILALRAEERVEALEVEIRAPDGPWRWAIAGGREGLDVRETAEGLRITAAGLKAWGELDLAPPAAAAGPTLHFSWGGVDDWDGVGSWFLELSRSVPRAAPEVRRKAAELLAGVESPRERLAALLAFAQREVRYVAVEVGIGGYRPSAPAETLARRWGDCKDKAFLLIDLLAEAGLAAHPALLRAGGPEPLFEASPSPFQFDHVIVAVPAAPLGLGEAEGVSGGYLFVDPTDPAGSVGWLPPMDRGRTALVVRAEGSHLVETPRRTDDQGLHAVLDLAVSETGDAAGSVRVEVRGSGGAALAGLLRSLDGPRAAAEVRHLLARWLPAAAVEEPAWTEVAGAASPVTVLESALHLPGFLQVRGADGTLDLQSLPTLEPPRAFDDREVPWVLEPRRDLVTWRLDLSRTGCVPAVEAVDLERPAGRFRQAVETAGGLTTIERETEIRRRWVEPTDGPQLRELALAEHRTAKRRIRLTCAAAPTARSPARPPPPPPPPRGPGR